jgi:drug/metabolite transporter (DMT)-like permease
MKCETWGTCKVVSPAILLLTDPRKFFSGLPGSDNGAWPYLLGISLVAGILNVLAGGNPGNWPGLLVFFINAVGMTCIFTGVVFIFARIVFRNPLGLGTVFSICAYASLGPILLSWIPGAMWVTEPWRWWASVAGLGVFTAGGTGRAALAVGLAVAALYGLMRGLLLMV